MPKRATKAKPDAETQREIAALKARIALLDGSRTTPTKQQQRDLDWLASRDRQQVIDSVLESFPKGLYCQLSGRQHKILDEQADRYDLPLRGATLDLGDVLSAFHDLLAEYGDRLFATDDRDALECEKLRAQIVQTNYRAELLKLDLAREKTDSINRIEVRNRLQWLSAELRSFGDRLGKRFGRDAQKLFNDQLTKIEREIMSGKLNMEPPIE